MLGGAPSNALWLGAAMTLLQCSIGAGNDLADRELDARAQPTKPIPAGLVPVRTARAVAVATAGLGLLLAAVPGSVAVVLLALLGLAVGILYDLRLRGTAWSWLPFALGVSTLIAFGAAGAGRPVLDPSLVVLILLALPAGAGLAIANALPDVAGDRAAGRGSVAVALGRRARPVGLALVAIPGAFIAAGVVGRTASTDGSPTVVAAVALVVAGSAAGLGGLLLASSGSSERGRRGWEAQGVGLALLALAWLVRAPLD